MNGTRIISWHPRVVCFIPSLLGQVSQNIFPIDHNNVSPIVARLDQDLHQNQLALGSWRTVDMMLAGFELLSNAL